MKMLIGQQDYCTETWEGSPSNNWLQMANAHIRWRLVLWRGLLVALRCQCCGKHEPCWQWGYGMASCKLGTTNALVHFIGGILNVQRHRDEILRPIVESLIHKHHLMLQCDRACCKDLYTIPGGWKHPRCSMASRLSRHLSHWACLGRSAWADTTASRLCQYQHLGTAIEEERTKSPQATINNLIALCWVHRFVVVPWDFLLLMVMGSAKIWIFIITPPWTSQHRPWLVWRALVLVVFG